MLYRLIYLQVLHSCYSFDGLYCCCPWNEYICTEVDASDPNALTCSSLNYWDKLHYLPSADTYDAGVSLMGTMYMSDSST